MILTWLVGTNSMTEPVICVGPLTLNFVCVPIDVIPVWAPVPEPIVPKIVPPTWRSPLAVTPCVKLTDPDVKFTGSSIVIGLNPFIFLKWPISDDNLLQDICELLAVISPVKDELPLTTKSPLHD